MSPVETAGERLLRLAVAAGLPDVELGTSYRSPALKLMGKGFAGIKDANLLSLRIPSDQKEILLEVAPEIYFETDHYKGWPWLLVRLDVISDAELQQRLTDSYVFRGWKKKGSGPQTRGSIAKR